MLETWNGGILCIYAGISLLSSCSYFGSRHPLHALTMTNLLTGSPQSLHPLYSKKSACLVSQRYQSHCALCKSHKILFDTGTLVTTKEQDQLFRIQISCRTCWLGYGSGPIHCMILTPRIFAHNCVLGAQDSCLCTHTAGRQVQPRSAYLYFPEMLSKYQ